MYMLYSVYYYYYNASFACRLSALLHCRRISGIAAAAAGAERRRELQGRRYGVRGWLAKDFIKKRGHVCSSVRYDRW